jgi:hypothetical protein
MTLVATLGNVSRQPSLVVRGKRKYQEKYINNCPVPGVPGNFL